MNLQRELARRGDDQRQRGGGALETFGIAEQLGRYREAIGDVLPEPVCADTSRSRPAASSASTAVCTGVRESKLRSARARASGGLEVRDVTRSEP
jgi:hypothetical protein